MRCDPPLRGSLVTQYKKLSHRRSLLIFSLFSCLVFAFITSLCVGSTYIHPSEVIASLLNSRGSNNDAIIWEIRLPRTLAAVVGGAALALGGAVVQASLRNPLASPFTLGISSAAGFGAALAIVLGAGRFLKTYLGGVLVHSHFPLIISSFCFSLLVILVVILLAKWKGAAPETIILAGIAMSFLFSAATSLVQFFGTTEQVASIVFWLFGSLSKASWEGFWTMLLALVTSSIPLYKWSYRYNALLIDDEVAKNLGVNPERIRLISMILASLPNAVVISFLGVIGFVCLASPHIARMIIGSNNKYLFPASMLVGANVLLLPDIVSRTLLPPLIIPVGIITSFLGVPVLLYLLLKKKRHWY
jgi:iron complex transport system permease protein